MTNSTGSCVDLSTDLTNQLVVWKNQIAGVFQGRGWESLQRFAHVLTESQCSNSSGAHQRPALAETERCWVGDCSTKQH